MRRVIYCKRSFHNEARDVNHTLSVYIIINILDIIISVVKVKQFYVLVQLIQMYYFIHYSWLEK
jgi:hypothetical protein